MGDGVEAGQAEELVGFEQGQAEGALHHHLRVQKPHLLQGGQHQRVGPDQNTGQQPAHGTRTGGAFPQDSADDGRRELRHGGKRHEPDGDERIGLADEVEV
ncbi:MAG: hypothetical protein MUC33_21340, partial [Desulfobacterales bacterium]|nr:hypothetical protein [Desulfobacterales bacterium]